MKQKKRSTGFILKTLGIFALLMAVSGLSAFSLAPYSHALDHTQHGTQSVIDTPDVPGAAATDTPGAATDTPGVSSTDTPGAATDTPGATSTDTPGVLPPAITGTPSMTETPSATGTSGAPGTPGQQTYIGAVPNANNPTNMTWVALSSSNGQQMTAFVTDGTKDHAPTFAHWYDGNLQNNKFSAQAGQPNAGKIDATLTQDTATGTITMPDGKTLPFTADVVQNTSANTGAGLYKSEQMVNGATYVVGWILAPNPTANPSATGTPAMTGTPSASGTPSATGTSTTPGISGIAQAGAIYNKQTKAVSPVPELTSDNLQTKQVTLPNLGQFNLTSCQANMC